MAFLQRITSTQAPAATILIRIVVGAVFPSEGIQKFIFSDEVGAGRFAKIPIPNADTVAPLIGGIETVCGILILAGLFTRLAALPLIAIMLTAIFTTKIPILLGPSLWDSVFVRFRIMEFGAFCTNLGLISQCFLARCFCLSWEQAGSQLIDGSTDRNDPLLNDPCDQKKFA